MNIKKFIKKVKTTLGLGKFEKANEKKYIKSLLKKLRLKKAATLKLLEIKRTKKEKKEINEDLEIIELHIKKGEKLLTKLKMETK
ncbi:MAG: hypothetical protein U9N30_01910 [Campylobacterota bacterium]|nr:hypothetical protein [Campylobacterota bacterium]